jgi:transcription antitermination factor NusG
MTDHTPLVARPEPASTPRRCWYALSTRPGRERQAARALDVVLSRRTAAAVRTDVPLDRDSNGRSRVRWSGLVLVDAPADMEWGSILRDVPGIVGFVGGTAVALADDEVERLRQDVQPMSVSRELAVGDSVEVAVGPFAGLPLTVTGLDDRVSGLVNIFGRETPVSVDRDQLLVR